MRKDNPIAFKNVLVAYGTIKNPSDRLTNLKIDPVSLKSTKLYSKNVAAFLIRNLKTPLEKKLVISPL